MRGKNGEEGHQTAAPRAIWRKTEKIGGVFKNVKKIFPVLSRKTSQRTHFFHGEGVRGEKSVLVSKRLT